VSADHATGFAALADVLAEARRRGFLGPGPLERHIVHGQGFVEAARNQLRIMSAEVTTPRVLDLGAGGGVPGLVVGLCWPSAVVTLLDSSERRTAFLEEARALLGLGDRLRVLRGRAEVVARTDGERHAYDVVVARSFAPPATTCECGAPFLRRGGTLVVSDAPEQEPDTPDGLDDQASAGSRWPADGPGQLGLGAPERVQHGGFSYRVMVATDACAERFPRREGVPAKRPLF
jgi:16S rRNA (guanine527-N7)-methyltransferase